VAINGTTLRPLRLPHADEHLRLVQEREQARREEQQSIALSNMGAQTLQNTGPWMERTGWPITFQAVRRDILLGLADPPAMPRGDDWTIGSPKHELRVISPAGDEQRIWHLTKAVEAVLDRCEETMRRTGRPLLCWLITTRPSPCFPKPFKFLARETTKKSYRRWLKGFLAFVFRAWRMEPGKCWTLAGVRFNRKHSARLQSIWTHRLWKHRIECDFWSKLAADQRRKPRDRTGDRSATDDSDREVEADEETEQDGSEEEDETDSESEDQIFESDIEGISEEGDDESYRKSHTDSCSEEAIPGNPSTEMYTAAAELLQLVFELCIAFMTEEFKDGQPSTSTLVYYSGILALQGNGESFRTAKLYTPILSRLIYIQRLLFLEYALPFEAYPRIGVERRPRYGQLERLNAVRLKYMVEGSMYPLAELQSLRDFGRVIGRTDAPSFLFRWSDDGQTISHGTKHVTMDSFRRFSKVFVDEAEDICRELMFGVLPPVDLSQVEDEISNTTQGFSFVHHPGNHLSEAYLDLSARACTTRRNGLLKEGRWNWTAVFLYLKRVEAFLEAAAGMCYLSGGQVPRVSELFGLECENGPVTARGLYVYNAHVVYLIRHHKAKRSTNREFYVARYLPARASRVMYYYLVYIGPFVRMLQRERRENSSTQRSTLLFCSVQTPDRPWESRKLTAVLQRASSPVWGWSVNVQLCRQLTIAITEKHVKEVHQPFNRYDDKSPNAGINNAYAWQSGHRPLQRANTYGLDGAFPTHLQPSLLQVYQWVSMRWHEFLRQPSKTFPSNLLTSVDGLQQQSLPVSLEHVLGQGTDVARITPTPTPIGLESDPTRKRKQRTEDHAAQPRLITDSNARKRLKSCGNQLRHPQNTAPPSPASSFLDDGSGPLIDDSDVGSIAPIPERSQQREQCSIAQLRPERQKSIERIQDARTGGDSTPTQSSTSSDNEQRHLVTQGNKYRTGFVGWSSNAAILSSPAKVAGSSHEPKSGDTLLSFLSRGTRKHRERLSASVDLKTLETQIKVWSERCSLCYVRGYWCSRNHKITQCPVEGADHVRERRSVLRNKMIGFRKRGGSFCSGQCRLSINISLFLSDGNLEPECACEFAVLDALSMIIGDPSREWLSNDIEELKQRAPGSQGQDLHAWLCSTEDIGGGKSATATRVFAQVSSDARRTATPEPIERSVNVRLAHEHIAQRNKMDRQLWLEGKQTEILHRLLGQLAFWGGVPCPLCLMYEWRESVYDHDLRDCRLREESASARKMFRFLCTVQQPMWRGSSQCASCGYSRRICKQAQDDGFELDDACDCIQAIKKGITVLLNVHDGVLREIVCPRLVIAETHQERVATRAWLEEEVDFWGLKVNRLLTVFHELADGYDGVTGKSNVRAVPEWYVS
jgi:hypothetical protein